MARPKIQIDAELVYKMAQWGCKTREIADHFNCSEDTISGRFSSQLAKGRADLRMSLRQWQLAAAKKGNPTMLIWLGKQMLGQADKADITATVTTNEKEDEEVKEIFTWLKEVKEIL